MLVFQVYAEPSERKKKAEGGKEGQDAMPFGMRAVHSGEIDLLKMDEHFAAKVALAEKSLSKEDISEFMGSLTPGAQNAIHASAFIWGYENAARYLKNAMKLTEVKNAADSEERSKAVIESMQKQSEGNVEKSKDTNTFVWGYYNEDLKESQAVAGKSEALSQSEKHEEKEREEQIKLPQTAEQAVGMSISNGNANPTLIYCASVHAEAEMHAAARVVEAKREQVRKLVAVERKEGKKAEEREEKKDETQLALERKEETEKEYLEVERKIVAAVDKLDLWGRDDRKNVERVAAMLPSELARHLRANEARFAKRMALRRQLVRWLATSRRLRASISSLPLDKLSRLVKLSKLFGN